MWAKEKKARQSWEGLGNDSGEQEYLLREAPPAFPPARWGGDPGPLFTQPCNLWFRSAL